jgi:cell pole-organizing protein PopZ
MASNPQHEPTMEEILASIRKIISEDSTEAPAAPQAAPAPAAAAPAPAPTPAPAPVAVADPILDEPEEEDEVLELTQEVPQEEAPKPEPVRLAPVPAPVEDDVVFEPAEKEAPASNDDIFSDKTRKAIDDTFSNIEPPKEEPKAAPVQRAFSGGVGASVEAVFERAVSEAFDPVLHQWMDTNKADLLNAVKPLIREWMDEHFPALLEGAVRNEVERVVKARGNR